MHSPSIASITLALLSASASSISSSVMAFSSSGHHHRPVRPTSSSAIRATAETLIENDLIGLSSNIPELWELGLNGDSFKNQPYEVMYITRCLHEVVGLPLEDAELVTSQAKRLGISLIEEFPLEYAEAYLEELESRGIICEMVPVEE